MLNFSLLQSQFSRFSRYRVEEEDRHQRRLEQGLQALDDCNGCWEQVREDVRNQRPKFLTAGLLEAPRRAVQSGERPTPVTVVATDGSQVYPDRHVDPPCYLLNISQIAFQYGTLERPVMDATPELRYRRADLDHVLDNLVDSLSANIVSAIRDVEELKTLRDVALRAYVAGRPVVAMGDGTLIRWMFSSLNRPELERKLTRDYVACLERFRQRGIPVCSYISKPANTEVVNLLRVFSGETEQTPPELALLGLRDRHLFIHVLEPRERSSVFESSSRIQDAYEQASGPHNRICYFYLHVSSPYGSEIARIECPRWVADDRGLLDLIHAVALDQTDKGMGYPVILSEAHQHAVIRPGEKELFYHLLERHLQAAGIMLTGTRKQISKDVPLV